MIVFSWILLILFVVALGFHIYRKYYIYEILIYGGAFDCWHLGHQYIVEKLNHLCELGCFREVWVVPSAVHPEGKQMTEFMTRCEIIEPCIKNLDNVILNHLEIFFKLMGFKGYTVDLLRMLKVRFPKRYRFVFVMGADNASRIEQWTKGDELVKEFKLFVVGRNGVSCKQFQKKPWFGGGVDLPTEDFAASVIRKELAAGNLEALESVPRNAQALVKQVYWKENKDEASFS